MSQFSGTPVRRRGGDLDVYTSLLLVATIVLAVGVTVLFLNNSEHSNTGSGGGAFKIVE